MSAFAKNYFAVGFKLDYVKADGDLSNYTPDFIVRTTDGTVWIVETKGREEIDVPQKMARLRQWCADATAASASGRRHAVPIRLRRPEGLRAAPAEDVRRARRQLHRVSIADHEPTGLRTLRRREARPHQADHQGKPLPEKYRFLLFQDKREVELVWNGKTREVSTAVLPFQTLEHIDEPRKRMASDAGGSSFDIRGRQLKGWTNKLIWGDNKLILSSLKSGALRQQIEDAGGLKLIYIDPPFDVGADFSMDIEIGGETFHKEPNLLEQIAYRDTWGTGADSFIAMIYERLILMRDLDARRRQHLRSLRLAGQPLRPLALDEVFGRQRS